MYLHVTNTYLAVMFDCIIVQGPYREGRTLDIIQIMLKNNPDSELIFSTWDDFITPEEFEKLSDRFHLIKSSFPAGSGSMNRHLQRISTHHGVIKAQSLGAKYILKIRSDQLIRRSNICDFFHTKLSEFGKDRLVVGSAGTTLEECWGRFHVGDWWMFGAIEHFLIWYDPTGIDTTNLHFVPERLIPSPEPDFTQLWMSKTNLKYDNFEDLLADKFIIIDCEDLELISKALPLNAPTDVLIRHWRQYGDPLTVRHEHWLKMKDSKH